jgi:hypothetical protein
MIRRLFTALSVASFVLLLASAAMWVRSTRALDQLYGDAGGVYFTVESCNGYWEASTHRRYHVREGQDPAADALAADRPFDLLSPSDDPTAGGCNFVARQRWPLDQTDRLDPEAETFPRPQCHAWLAWARDGPGQYEWVNQCRVPYWLACLAFLLSPAVAAVRAAGFGRRRSTGMCRSCGYDLRASPDRCPECGAVPTKGAA